MYIQFSALLISQTWCKGQCGHISVILKVTAFTLYYVRGLNILVLLLRPSQII